MTNRIPCGSHVADSRSCGRVARSGLPGSLRRFPAGRTAGILGSQTTHTTERKR